MLGGAGNGTIEYVQNKVVLFAMKNSIYNYLSNINHLMDFFYEELLLKIIKKWGRDTQINKIQEEALELALAINQMKCPTKNIEQMEANLYDELADMKIMMAQAEILFDSKRINEQVKFKLDKCHQKYFNN